MIKQDIINQLAENTNLSKSQATEAVQGVVDILAKAFIAGETVSIRGLATFRSVVRAKKTARNISKAVVVEVPAHRTVKLILSDSIKKQCTL
jgi:DNA-binding protein HU-beta